MISCDDDNTLLISLNSCRDEQLNTGWNQLSEKLFSLDPEMKAWHNDYVRIQEFQTWEVIDIPSCVMIVQLAPMFRKSEEIIFPEPSTKLKIWDLAFLGVSSKHQRKGIGRALIEDCERIVSATITHILAFVSLFWWNVLLIRGHRQFQDRTWSPSRCWWLSKLRHPTVWVVLNLHIVLKRLWYYDSFE